MSNLDLNRASKILTVIGVLLILMGCGASKTASSSGSAGNSSQETGRGDFSDDLTLEKGFTTHCSSFANSDSTITGLMTANDSSATSTLDYDTARLALKSTPIELSSGDDHKLVIYPFSETAMQSTPASFDAYLRGPGTKINSSALTQISRVEINQMIRTFNLTSRGVNAGNFFDKVIFIVRGLSRSDQGLLFALYPKTENASAVREARSLLPIYDSDPRSYAQTHSDELLALHPNRNAGTLSHREYYDLASDPCKDF